MRSDILRMYRIDVESDSTIRGDLARNQQQMSAFLQGTAQFAQSMGPIVQQSPEALPVVLEIYAAFARQFKLGKQAEDALDSMADKVRQGPQAPKPDPKAEAEKAKTEAAVMKSKADVQTTQMKAQASQAEHQMTMTEMQGQAALSQQELQNDAQRLAMEQQRNAMNPQPVQWGGQ
jgi:hypothetical protein